MTKTATKAVESAPAPTAAAIDPFADVPVITTKDGSTIKDFSSVEVNNPYKYADVHKRAVELKHPMLVNYKHGKSVLVQGSSRKEYKPGSVYGTIQQIGQQAGKGGVPVYEALTQLRQQQIGNKRSKYCEKLPPIGWAEGWLNTAISKGIVNIHATKTADHFAPEAAPMEPEAEQKKVASK